MGTIELKSEQACLHQLSPAQEPTEIGSLGPPGQQLTGTFLGMLTQFAPGQSFWRLVLRLLHYVKNDSDLVSLESVPGPFLADRSEDEVLGSTGVYSSHSAVATSQ